MSFFAAAKFWCRRARYYQDQAVYYTSQFYEAARQTSLTQQALTDREYRLEFYREEVSYLREENARLRREVDTLCNWTPESTRPGPLEDLKEKIARHP